MGEGNEKKSTALIQDTLSYFCFFILLPQKVEERYQQT